MEDVFEAEEDRGRGLEASDWDGPSNPAPQRQVKPTLMAQLVELQEENARLREDAERYRWLRDSEWDDATHIYYALMNCPESGNELDEAIDAAKKEQK